MNILLLLIFGHLHLFVRATSNRNPPFYTEIQVHTYIVFIHTTFQLKLNLLRPLKIMKMFLNLNSIHLPSFLIPKETDGHGESHLTLLCPDQRRVLLVFVNVSLSVIFILLSVILSASIDFHDRGLGSVLVFRQLVQ